MRTRIFVLGVTILALVGCRDTWEESEPLSAEALEISSCPYFCPSGTHIFFQACLANCQNWNECSVYGGQNYFDCQPITDDFWTCNLWCPSGWIQIDSYLDGYYCDGEIRRRCVAGDVCGDGACYGSETSDNCYSDCGWCGDGTCNGSESLNNCYSDCGWCGDGTCSGPEGTADCAADCGSQCGDGTCNGSESLNNCYSDCGWCGDGVCTSPHEQATNCSQDCGSLVETTITNGPYGSIDAISFTFKAQPSGSTFKCKMDGGSYTNCSSPKTYVGLSFGSHTFRVRARSSTGVTDATPAVKTWSIASCYPSQGICKTNIHECVGPCLGEPCGTSSDCTAGCNAYGQLICGWDPGVNVTVDADFPHMSPLEDSEN